MIALLIFSKNCSSLDISYRNVSVVPFKFHGYIGNLNKIIQMLMEAGQRSRAEPFRQKAM